MANMDDDLADETVFVVEDVRKVVKESIEATIGENAYQQNRVNQWTTNVVEQSLSQLSKLGKPFKYIVTCVIMQKTGAGVQSASACFWDNTTDGQRDKTSIIQLCLGSEKNKTIHFQSSTCHPTPVCLKGNCSVTWENKSMYCIVSVFGLAI